MNSANTGLRQALRDFFTANPGEELTKAEMATKFGATQKAVDQAIWALSAEGRLVRAIVYRGVGS